MLNYQGAKTKTKKTDVTVREFTGKHGEGTPIFHRKSWEVNSKLAESKIHNWLVDPQHVTTSSNLG